MTSDEAHQWRLHSQFVEREQSLLEYASFLAIGSILSFCGAWYFFGISVGTGVGATGLLASLCLMVRAGIGLLLLQGREVVHHLSKSRALPQGRADA